MTDKVPKWRSKPIPCNRCGKDNWKNSVGSCAVCYSANFMEFAHVANWQLPDNFMDVVKAKIDEETAFLEGKFSKIAS